MHSLKRLHGIDLGVISSLFVLFRFLYHPASSVKNNAAVRRMSRKCILAAPCEHRNVTHEKSDEKLDREVQVNFCG